MNDINRQMPLYQSHKKVWALQIEESYCVPAGAQLHFRDHNFAGRVVGADVVSRYFPKSGDYLVQYEDGYLSISPQKTFEDGYTLIT